MRKEKTGAEFIAKAKEIFGDAYTYEKVVYVNNNSKVIVTCRAHGDFEILPRSITAGHGCAKCANKFMTNEMFLLEAKEVHGDKYDYSNTTFTGRSNKISYICPIHGIIHQKASNHLRGDGCGYCNGGKPINTQIFIERAIDKHGNKYDYSKVEYKKSNIKIEILCKQHKSFLITPNAHLMGRGCPICSHEEQKTLIYGIGINDMNRVSTDGEHDYYYKIWARMLERCYSSDYHIKKPSYKGCYVCNEWLTLSNFKKWCDENYIEGYVIDKDILVRGNKLYSPDTCRFIPVHINSLLVKTDRSRGEYPIGVTVHGDSDKFTARVNEWGKTIHIGEFENMEDAFLAYKNRKELHIKEVANFYYSKKLISKDIFNSLLLYEVNRDD